MRVREVMLKRLHIRRCFLKANIKMRHEPAYLAPPGKGRVETEITTTTSATVKGLSVSDSAGP